MGDFNINTMDEISCTLSQEQEFNNLFATLHYQKLINLPTRITQKTSSLLDNINTTLPHRNSSKGVLISDHSDHYIVFTIQHGTTNTKAPTHRTRCTRGDARRFFSVLTKRICMHKTKFLINIFKYCFKNYIKLHEFANCNSANYDV